MSRCSARSSSSNHGTGPGTSFIRQRAETLAFSSTLYDQCAGSPADVMIASRESGSFTNAEKMASHRARGPAVVFHCANSSTIVSGGLPPHADASSDASIVTDASVRGLVTR